MRPVSVAGIVRRALVQAGSKSERNAVVLETGEGRRYILRRQGGPALADRELEMLVGKSLVATGIESEDTLIMRDWRANEEASR